MSEAEQQAADEIKTLVDKFESCGLHPSQFKHEAHLTVALWYLLQFSQAQATERMRENLRKLLRHYNIEGYNETMTLFWMRRMNSFLNSAGEEQVTALIIRRIIAACGSSQLVYDYYSKERILSEEARATWIEPDLKPLDF